MFIFCLKVNPWDEPALCVDLKFCFKQNKQTNKNQNKENKKTTNKNKNKPKTNKPPGGHLYFRLDIIRVKGLSKQTVNTYFSWIFLRGWYPTSNTSGPPREQTIKKKKKKKKKTKLNWTKTKIKTNKKKTKQNETTKQNRNKTKTKQKIFRLKSLRLV